MIGTIVVNADGESTSRVYISRKTGSLYVKVFTNCFIFSGIPIRTTLDNSTAIQYAGLFRQLTVMARSTVRDIDPQNDLLVLRVRSKKHEILVAPGEFVVVTFLLFT